jgi:hypothetical protein
VLLSSTLSSFPQARKLSCNYHTTAQRMWMCGSKESAARRPTRCGSNASRARSGRRASDASRARCVLRACDENRMLLLSLDVLLLLVFAIVVNKRQPMTFSTHTTCVTLHPPFVMMSSSSSPSTSCCVWVWGKHHNDREDVRPVFSSAMSHCIHLTYAEAVWHPKRLKGCRLPSLPAAIGL